MTLWCEAKRFDMYTCMLYSILGLGKSWNGSSSRVSGKSYQLQIGCIEDNHRHYNEGPKLTLSPNLKLDP